MSLVMACFSNAHNAIIVSLMRIFLERNFLEEKHGRDAASEFVSAEIGCSTSQWIAWLLIGGSHALLEQQTECGEGEKKGVYFIPKRGLGPNK